MYRYRVSDIETIGKVFVTPNVVDESFVVDVIGCEPTVTVIVQASNNKVPVPVLERVSVFGLERVNSVPWHGAHTVKVFIKETVAGCRECERGGLIYWVSFTHRGSLTLSFLFGNSVTKIFWVQFPWF